MIAQHLTSLAEKARPNVQTFHRFHLQMFASSNLPPSSLPTFQSSIRHLFLEKEIQKNYGGTNFRPPLSAANGAPRARKRRD